MPHFCINTECKSLKLNGNKRRASFNVVGKSAIYCKDCKTDGMINVRSTNFTCIFISEDGKRCTTQPTFNIPGERPKYCRKHKDHTMINTLNRKCIKCTAIAYYNVFGESMPKYCYLHKNDSMINVKERTCYKCKSNARLCSPDKLTWACKEHKEDNFIYPNKTYCLEGCGNLASFNLLGQKTGIYCSKHRDPNMIDITHTRCEYETCLYQALFGFEKDGKKKFCSEHSKDGMINLCSKKCIDCKKKAPSFNWEGETSPIYCGDCKLDDMVNIRTIRCNKCSTTASFNYEGFISPIVCKTHIEPGMICVTKKPCQYSGCTVRPSFNFEGQITPIFCQEHKDPNMINIKKDCCKLCDKSPSHNYPDLLPEYCSSCALSDMIDVKSRKCIHPKCDGKTRALYNLPQNPTPEYCIEHKTNNMINVIARRCDDTRCIIFNKTPTTALFGYPGDICTKCTLHKSEGMIMFPKRRCLTSNCREYAIFGKDSSRGEYCEEHAPHDYRSIISKRCSECNLIDIIDDEGYCPTCHPHNFNVARLAKQNKVVAWLTANGHDDYVSIDTVPDEIMECREGQKYSYRPDIFYNCGTHYVIIEVDEKQHKEESYKKCEIPRMINIQQSLALPTIFIRYNPDNFRIDGKSINITEKHRMKILNNWLIHAKQLSTSIPLQAVYLFYDDFNESSNNYIKIDILDFIRENKSPIKLMFKKKHEPPKKLLFKKILNANSNS